jgi:hypothetical protein
MMKVLVAAQISPEINTAMILVQNLLAAPSSLLRPSMVRKVLRAAREAERRPVARRASTPARDRRREPLSA